MFLLISPYLISVHLKAGIVSKGGTATVVNDSHDSARELQSDAHSVSVGNGLDVIVEGRSDSVHAVGSLASDPKANVDIVDALKEARVRKMKTLFALFSFYLINKLSSANLNVLDRANNEEQRTKWLQKMREMKSLSYQLVG